MTSQELCNVASYFIKILKLRHGDQSILKKIIIPNINKYILANGVDKAKGIEIWGSKNDKAYVDFILPLANLVLAFESPAKYDASQSDKEIVNDYDELVDDPTGDKVEDLMSV